MKRKGLRLTLAEAVSVSLGMTHALTIPNAKRYVTRDVMRHFRINSKTEIHMSDWIVAIQVCREDRRNHFSRMSKNDTTVRYDRFVHIIRSININDRDPSTSKPIQ